MLVKIFEEQVRKHPDHIAVKAPDRSVTYGELDHTANRVVHAVRQIVTALPEVAAGGPDRQPMANPGGSQLLVVGLLFEHGVDMIIGLVSAIKAGYIYVPLDPGYPESRLRYMLEHAGVSLIVTNGQNRELAARLQASLAGPAEILEIDSIPEESPAGWVERPALRDEVAYILYTSGSTGLPKGVAQTHRNIWHFIRNYIKDYGITGRDRLTLFSAFSHDAAVMDIYSGLLSGATLYPLNLKNQVNLADLANWLREERITIYHSVPTVYRYFTGMLTGRERFPDLRWVILGGESVLRHDVVTFARIFESHTTLVNLYGQSESSYNAAQFIRADAAAEKITLGQAVEGCEIWVVTEENEETADFEIGEIIVSCDHIALGYWRDPERTAQVFIDSPEAGRLYRTGDLGRRRLDGRVEFVGRKDFQVKVRGYRVDLSEIESRLLEHPLVKEAVVLAKADPEGNTFLCAYVVAANEIGDAGLKGYLAGYLPDYMVPAFYVYMDHLPVTPTNKIDRNALPEPERSSREEGFTPPRNPLEEAVRQIWARILRLDEAKISAHTSFFDLGGNSLSVMNLATSLSREFRKNVRIPDLFRHSTVEAMAGFLAAEADPAAVMEPISRVPDAEWYPVSSAQQRMFVIDQLEGNTTAYNLPLVLHIETPLDQTRFRTALERLTERHESLRTSFHLVEDTLVQKVHPGVEMPLEVYTFAVAAPESEVEAVIARFIRPFSLGEAPLFRVGLIQWGTGQVLLFDIHHIISDGTSNDLLITEFLRLYSGEELPSLPIQYRDFAVWQRKLLAGRAGEAQEHYWLGQFDPRQVQREIPLLNLPTDFPRPVQQSFAGGRVHFAIDAELTAQVRELARKSEATLFMVLLAAYNLLLAKYSGQEDLIVGSPVAGRPQPELNQVPGMFVNTLALRSYPEGRKGFQQYLAEVRGSVLLALEHQDYPFELLVSKLKLKRDTGRNPLFDACFRLQNFLRSEVTVNEIRLKPYRYDHPVSQFDLQLTCYEVGDSIRCNFEYATSLFAEMTIREMTAHFLCLIGEAVAAPEKRICEIGMLPPEERRRLLTEWNATGTEFRREMTIHQLFEAQVQRTPDAPALVAAASSGEERTAEHLTYRVLNERANQLAAQLRAKGVARETIVGLLAGRSASLVIGMLAVLKAGGAYLPLDPEYPAERVQYILDNSGATLLLTQSSLTHRVEFAGEQILLDDPALYQGDAANLTHINQSSDLIYLIYTSGSTGRPKGTMLEHRAVHNFTVGMRQVIDFTPERVMGSLTTVSFDIFVLESLLPLTVGMKVVMATEEEQRDPRRFLDLMVREGVDMIQLTPSRLQVFLDDPQARRVFAQMRAIMVGGEALPQHLLERLRPETPAAIYNMYGPTETTVWSTIADLTHAETVTIGLPIANTTVYILNQQLEPVPPRVVGELYIGGEGLARGYYQQPELTEERFIADPFHPGKRIYRTGDLARRLPDGRIEYMGRSDQQVKIRGYRIEVGEIEALLSRYPGIRESAVIARNGADGLKYLAAYYAADEEIPVSSLRQELLRNLPDYMVPGIFHRMEALPLTPNGKIDRKALPDVEGQRPYLATVYQAPESGIERQMAAIWSQVLKIENIGIHDNFFDLGGNSLLLVQLRQKLEQSWPGKVAVADLFAYPTIGKLTAFLEQKEAGKAQIRNAGTYWKNELGEEFAFLTLPAEYYQTPGGIGQYNLRLELPHSHLTGLREMAGRLGVNLIDLTVGMYIFLLREVSGQDRVMIEVSLPDDPDRIVPLQIDLSTIEDLTVLFEQVHRKSAEAAEMFHDRLPALLRKRLVPSQVLPLFTSHTKTSRRENDLIFIQQEDQDGLTVICEYNGGKLAGRKVEELVEDYFTFLGMLVEQNSE